MGGRLTFHEGCLGGKFAVWAPQAKAVSVVDDFNHWDGREYPMCALESSGVWELFIPDLKEGSNINSRSELKKIKLSLKVIIMLILQRFGLIQLLVYSMWKNISGRLKPG